MCEKYYEISEFAQRIGVHPQTLRKWARNGTLVPAQILPSGRRRYTEQQAIDYEHACKQRAEKVTQES